MSPTSMLVSSSSTAAAPGAPPPAKPPTNNHSNQSNKNGKKTNPLLHLVAGGAAGLVESSVCHPLDTIKTRMQLRRQNNTVESAVKKMRDSLMEPTVLVRSLKHSLQEPVFKVATAATASSSGATSVTTTLDPALLVASGAAGRGHHHHQHHTTVVIKPAYSNNNKVVQAPLGPIGTATRIIKREGFMALYKGLTAVYMGIIPKMAIRFVSFEQFRELGTTMNGGTLTTSITFTAGLLSGLTEAILVVTPAEVCKIRMQSQYNSMIDPAQLQHRKYTNVFQTALTIVREEGVRALYSGVVPTMLRQGCNQAVNFTAYNMIKTKLMNYQGTSELASWQSLLIGGLSGGMGPLVNNPLDVVKTRLQKQVVVPGKTPKYTGLVQGCMTIAQEEGVLSLWKGITPRLLRIMPGQAITFMTYEAVSSQLIRFQAFA